MEVEEKFVQSFQREKSNNGLHRTTLAEAQTTTYGIIKIR